jgi:hypothetical protein
VTKVRHLRGWVAALLFGAAVLNYVDRQTLSALAPTIQRDLGFDDRACAVRGHAHGRGLGSYRLAAASVAAAFVVLYAVFR